MSHHMHFVTLREQTGLPTTSTSKCPPYVIKFTPQQYFPEESAVQEALLPEGQHFTKDVSKKIVAQANSRPQFLTSAASARVATTSSLQHLGHR